MCPDKKYKLITIPRWFVSDVLYNKRRRKKRNTFWDNRQPCIHNGFSFVLTFIFDNFCSSSLIRFFNIIRKVVLSLLLLCIEIFRKFSPKKKYEVFQWTLFLIFYWWDTKFSTNLHANETIIFATIFINSY